MVATSYNDRLLSRTISSGIGAYGIGIELFSPL
jgi:hypothetical protein